LVALHADEHGKHPPRGTTDADVLVNARAVQDGTERFSRLLVDQRFCLDGVSPEGIGHRFTDGRVKIDVLAPDGLDRLCDRGLDLGDCLALAPTAEELRDALPWLAVQDANPGSPAHAAATLADLGRRLGHVLGDR